MISGLLLMAIGIGVGLSSYLLLLETQSDFPAMAQAKAAKRVFRGAELLPVSVAAFSKIDGQLRVEGFDGDQIVFAYPTLLSFEQYPFIEIKVDQKSLFLLAKLIWQPKAGGPSQSVALPFDRNGRARLFMPAHLQNISEEIESFALLFYDGPEPYVLNNEGTPLIIESISFASWSFSRGLAFVGYRLFHSPGLGPSSNNVERNTFFGDFFSTNIMIYAGLTVAIILLFLGARVSSKLAFGPTLIVLFVISFVLMDAFRWQWRLNQIDPIVTRHMGLPLEMRAARHWSRCTDFPVDCGAHLLPYY